MCVWHHFIYIPFGASDQLLRKNELIRFTSQWSSAWEAECQRLVMKNDHLNTDQRNKIKETFLFVRWVFLLAQVPPKIMEEAGVWNNNETSHSGAIVTLWIHLWGAFMSSICKYRKNPVKRDIEFITTLTITLLHNCFSSCNIYAVV